MKTLSLVFPIHNRAIDLRRDVQFLIELLSSLTCTFQIIIVDDGSSDGSDDVVADLAKEYPQINAVYHANRRGRREAAKSGVKLARYERLFVQSEDVIDESEIRDFLSQKGQSQFNPGPSEEAVPESSEVPVTKVTRVESNDQAQKENLESRLVERLMQWGMALRQYKEQSITGIHQSRCLTESPLTGLVNTDGAEGATVAEEHGDTIDQNRTGVTRPETENRTDPAHVEVDSGTVEASQDTAPGIDPALSADGPFDSNALETATNVVAIEPAFSGTIEQGSTSSIQPIADEVMLANSIDLFVEQSNAEPKPSLEKTTQAKPTQTKPTRYTSVAELRLTNLSRRDLARQAAATA